MDPCKRTFRTWKPSASGEPAPTFDGLPSMETNISPINLKMIFLFPWWDMWSFPGYSLDKTTWVVTCHCGCCPIDTGLGGEMGPTSIGSRCRTVQPRRLKELNCSGCRYNRSQHRSQGNRLGICIYTHFWINIIMIYDDRNDAVYQVYFSKYINIYVCTSDIWHYKIRVYLPPILSVGFILFGHLSTKTPSKHQKIKQQPIGQKKGGFQTGFDTGSYFEIGTSLEDLYFQRFRTTQLGGVWQWRVSHHQSWRNLLMSNGTDRNVEEIFKVVGVWPKFEIVNCVMYAAFF